MLIAIHTYGRARANDQQTMKWLSPSARLDTFLVVQHRETEGVSGVYYRNAVKDNFLSGMLVLPPEIQRLSPTRQWIIEEAARRGEKKVVLLDDDLAFYVRKSPTDWHLRYVEYDDTDRMFNLLEGWLDEVAHVGISPREGNNRVESSYTEATRAMRVLGYRTDVFLKEGVRFDRIDTKQDFDVTLQLLRKGYPNRVSYEFAQGQWTGSQARGGCASYRDEAMMTRCAEELAALHPGFVRVDEKKTKSAWKDLGGVRKDVTMAWKKALGADVGGEIRSCS